MRGILYGTVALALCAAAPAQGADDAESGRINRGAAEAQMPPQNSPPVNVEPVVPSGADGQAAKPSAGAQDPAADPNTGIAPTGPIGATRQTMPAKFSSENAAMDERPIMAHPIDLSDEQKRRIYDAVAGRDDNVVRAIEAGPATVLPTDVVLHDLPDAIVQEIPMVKDYKYVRLPEKVLLVRSPNRIVVGEIVR